MLSRHIILGFCIIGLAVSGAAVCDESGSQAPAAASDQTQAATAKPSEPDKPYTSVIIDTTGFNLQRSMSPKLRKPDGTEVWGTVKVDYDALQDRGVVAYARSLEDAKKNERCGSNPVILRAVAVRGVTDSDAVICAEDAKLLVAENNKGHFLDKFNVIFVQCSKPATTASAQ